MKFSYKVARAIKRAVPCERVGMSVIGLEVPHVHVHLIPLHTMADANFSKKEELTKSQFEEIAHEISRNFYL
jgi:histidine triad (HIT) family protein